jgi:hypothetical protein
MTRKESHEPHGDKNSPDYAAMAKKGVEELSAVQSELFKEIRTANQNWLDRVESEVALASEFTSKLAASHSASDTTTACQEWAKRRMGLYAEDSKRLMTDGQKFMANAARLFSNGWFSNGRNGGHI